MQCLRDIANSPKHILAILVTNGIKRGVWEREVLHFIRILSHLAFSLWGLTNALITVTYARLSGPIGNVGELLREDEVYSPVV